MVVACPHPLETAIVVRLDVLGIELEGGCVLSDGEISRRNRIEMLLSCSDASIEMDVRSRADLDGTLLVVGPSDARDDEKRAGDDERYSQVDLSLRTDRAVSRRRSETVAAEAARAFLAGLLRTVLAAARGPGG